MDLKEAIKNKAQEKLNRRFTNWRHHPPKGSSSVVKRGNKKRKYVSFKLIAQQCLKSSFFTEVPMTAKAPKIRIEVWKSDGSVDPVSLEQVIYFFVLHL